MMMLLSESVEQKSNLNILSLRLAISGKPQEMPRSAKPY
jgi:hypothetical protein